MSPVLHGLLRNAILKAVIQCEYCIDSYVMESGDAAAITALVRSKLVRQLCGFAADHKILNDPDCFVMTEDRAADSTRVRVRACLLSPNELNNLLEQAFKAGRISAGT